MKTRTEDEPTLEERDERRDEHDEPGNGPVGPERACGDGSDVTARAGSEPCRSGEPDAQEREEPEDDRQPGTVGKTLGDDAPRVGPRRLGRVQS